MNACIFQPYSSSVRKGLKICTSEDQGGSLDSFVRCPVIELLGISSLFNLPKN